MWKLTGYRQRTGLNSDKRRPLSKSLRMVCCSSVHKKSDIKHLLDPLFKDQWHLVNDGHPEHTMNTTPVWVLGFSFKDVLVSYIDDGLYFEADDLKDTFVPLYVIVLFLLRQLLGCRDLLRRRRPLKLMARLIIMELGVRAKWQLEKTMHAVLVLHTTRKLLVSAF